MSMLYTELRRLAHGCLRGERRGHTLNTTALVHEAYVKLAALDRIVWRDRSHFLAMAGRVMRRVLIDYALARKARKRDGGDRVPLETEAPDQETPVEDLLAIDEALTGLERLNARLVRVVECRVFAGMSIDETAGAVGASPATVKRDWSVARAWLNRELGDA
jgi:RNA polymerase sigma factor (TIGR02999 family)